MRYLCRRSNKWYFCGVGPISHFQRCIIHDVVMSCLVSSYLFFYNKPDGATPASIVCVCLGACVVCCVCVCVCVVCVWCVALVIQYTMRMRSTAICGVSCCRPRLKRDGTRAETRFRLSAKRSSPFKSAGVVSLVDCWQPRCEHQR